MTSQNYSKGAGKSFGDQVRVNEYRAVDPDNLPRVGDFIVLKTRAHQLVDVTPSGSVRGTIRYRAIIRRITEVPKTARRFDSEPNIRSY